MISFVVYIEYCFEFLLFFKYVQCWIYEYFPTITSSIVAEDYHERKPRACRWKSGKALPVSTYRKRLDRLTSDVVCWIPYGDHHEFREFELISLFSRHIRWGPSIVIHRESCAPVWLCADHSSTHCCSILVYRRD